METMKTCKNCHARFKSTNNHRKFCSFECSRHWSRHHQKEHDETKFPDQIIREFTCKHCGKRVLISDTDDRRIVFCCVNCERRYWKHPERASHRGSNNGMSGGMSLNNLKLREARDLD